MDAYASTFKALSDPTRLRLLRLLLEAGTELCVCELVDSLEEPQYNVSKHLSVLKAAGLIESRKEGRWLYSRPVPTKGPFLTQLHRAVAAVPGDQIERDRRELRKRLKLRQAGKCVFGVQKPGLLAASKPSRSRHGH